MEENKNQGLFNGNSQGGDTQSGSEQKPEKSSSDNSHKADEGQAYKFDADKKEEAKVPASSADGQAMDQKAETPTNLVGDSGVTGNDPKYPIAEEPKKEESSDKKKIDAKPIIRAVIIIVIVALAIWFFSARGDDNKNPDVNGEQDNQESVDIIVDDSKEQGSVEISSDDSDDQSQNQDDVLPEGRVKITAYYSKSGEEDCSQVVPLEREIEKKYDSEVVNTVRGLLVALSSDEVARGFTTNIPFGTWLNNVFVSGTGVATVDLNNTINETAGSCAVTAVKAQIEQTLLQFPYISSVVICAESNCDRDEVLQP